jgi:hypothetical protein
MPGIKRRKCRNCRELFIADARNATRQRYCSKPSCRRASKAASQKRWLQKEENRDYFHGPDNVLRVQRWREANPGYWRRSKHCSHALQDPLTRQVSVNNHDTADFALVALQDALILQPAVVIGLIAQFTGYALQDDIAMAARRMQQLGNDILNPQLKGGRHGSKTSAAPGKGPQNPPTVQLDRSTPGAPGSH